MAPARYVGMNGETLPEVQKLSVTAGDRLLLCTDGLHGMLSDRQSSEIIASCSDPNAACRRFIETANDRGANDNITAVLIEAKAKPRTAT